MAQNLQIEKTQRQNECLTFKIIKIMEKNFKVELNGEKHYFSNWQEMQEFVVENMWSIDTKEIIVYSKDNYDNRKYYVIRKFNF